MTPPDRRPVSARLNRLYAAGGGLVGPHYLSRAVRTREAEAPMTSIG
jgi:hypothetical protein